FCTRWIAGNAAAAISMFLVSMTPAILAHSGVATTDMALTATLLLAIYMGWRFLDELVKPKLWRALAFGAAIGLAVLSKFSALPFLPSVAVAGIVIWWWSERPAAGSLLKMVATKAPQFGVVAVACCLVIWAGYRFTFHRYPAPEFFDGLREVRD